MSLVWHQDDWLDEYEQPPTLTEMAVACFVLYVAELWDFMEGHAGKLLAMAFIAAACWFLVFVTGWAIVTHWDWLRSLA